MKFRSGKGAIVISIAYNATPEMAADTSALDSNCISDAVPRLPVAPPSTPVYAAEPVRAHELAIVPLENGTYSVVVGTLSLGGKRVARCRIVRRP